MVAASSIPETGCKYTGSRPVCGLGRGGYESHTSAPWAAGPRMTRDEFKLVRVASTVALGGFLVGFDATVISGAVPFIRDYFGLGGSAGSLKLGSAVSCGGAGRPGGFIFWAAALGAGRPGMAPEQGPRGKRTGRAPRGSESRRRSAGT